MKWMGVDTERLTHLFRHLVELEHAIAAIGPLDDPHGDRMRDEARRLAADGAVTARRVLVEFTVGSLSARWFDQWGDEFAGWWVERHVFETTAADRLLQRLLAHPEMAGVFVDHLTRPEALVHGVNDHDALQRFWALVTDPATVPEDVAVSRIRTLLLGLFAEPYWENVPATRIEDPTMKTRNALLFAAVAPAIAAWQLNLPGMLGEIGSSTEEGRVFLDHISSREELAAEMRAYLPVVFDRTLEFMPSDRTEQHLFFSALGYATSGILGGLRSWTREELALNLDLLREVGNLLSFVPGPYVVTTVPTTMLTMISPSHAAITHGLSDAEKIELHRLKVGLANAAARAFVEGEVAAGRHEEGSTELSDDLLGDVMTIRWTIDSPYERGVLWRSFDEYYEYRNPEKAVSLDPDNWSEIFDRDQFVKPD